MASRFEKPFTCLANWSIWLFSLRVIALASVLALVTGCGFQLAGAARKIDVASPVYVAAEDRYTPFYLALVNQLRTSNVAVTDRASEARAVLSIRRDETGQRVLSLSARNQPREFEVFYTVSYDLAVGGELRAVASDVTLTRDYTWNESEVLGKAREEGIIRDALVELLLEDLARRVAGER